MAQQSDLPQARGNLIKRGSVFPLKLDHRIEGLHGPTSQACPGPSGWHPFPLACSQRLHEGSVWLPLFICQSLHWLHLLLESIWQPLQWLRATGLCLCISFSWAVWQFALSYSFVLSCWCRDSAGDGTRCSFWRQVLNTVKAQGLETCRQKMQIKERNTGNREPWKARTADNTCLITYWYINLYCARWPPPFNDSAVHSQEGSGLAEVMNCLSHDLTWHRPWTRKFMH